MKENKIGQGQYELNVPPYDFRVFFFIQTYHPICYEDAKKFLAEPTSPATATPEEVSNNPLNVIMSALQNPTTTQGE